MAEEMHIGYDALYLQEKPNEKRILPQNHLPETLRRENTNLISTIPMTSMNGQDSNEFQRVVSMGCLTDKPDILHLPLLP